MVEQYLQVKFTPARLFAEEYKEGRRLISQGKKVVRMFTLDADVLEVKAAMFA